MGNNYIRFDWAMKRLLRDKANFAVLEGLITTALHKKLTIQKIMADEDYNEDEFQKQYRVDILAKELSGESVLIELQNHNELAYYQRTLFGTSKLLNDYIQHGRGYNDVRKVYCIHIVYFKLGHNSDYIYHGVTEFRGVHTDEALGVSPFQCETIPYNATEEYHPECYVLYVNGFNKWSKESLEQWMYYLNTGEIPQEADAPGLPEARERLKLDCLTKDELNAYYRHLDDLVILRDNIYTAREEGRMEGRAEIREQTRLEDAKLLKNNGVNEELIAQSLGLSIEIVKQL